ncbi:hypothetical protein D3C81_1530740 [compost metagenome]
MVQLDSHPPVEHGQARDAGFFAHVEERAQSFQATLLGADPQRSGRHLEIGCGLHQDFTFANPDQALQRVEIHIDRSIGIEGHPGAVGEGQAPTFANRRVVVGAPALALVQLPAQPGGRRQRQQCGQARELCPALGIGRAVERRQGQVRG